MAEQLICNQQVDGSTPFTSSTGLYSSDKIEYMGEFPSGQRGQTVNLLSVTSVVRIHLPPPEKGLALQVLFQFYSLSASYKVLHMGWSYSKVLLSGDVLILLHSYIALSRMKLHFAPFESIEYLFKL